MNTFEYQEYVRTFRQMKEAIEDNEEFKEYFRKYSEYEKYNKEHANDKGFVPKDVKNLVVKNPEAIGDTFERVALIYKELTELDKAENNEAYDKNLLAEKMDDQDYRKKYPVLRDLNSFFRLSESKELKEYETGHPESLSLSGRQGRQMRAALSLANIGEVFWKTYEKRMQAEDSKDHQYYRMKEASENSGAAIDFYKGHFKNICTDIKTNPAYDVFKQKMQEHDNDINKVEEEADREASEAGIKAKKMGVYDPVSEEKEYSENEEAYRQFYAMYPEKKQNYENALTDVDEKIRAFDEAFDQKIAEAKMGKKHAVEVVEDTEDVLAHLNSSKKAVGMKLESLKEEITKLQETFEKEAAEVILTDNYTFKNFEDDKATVRENERFEAVVRMKQLIQQCDGDEELRKQLKEYYNYRRMGMVQVGETAADPRRIDITMFLEKKRSLYGKLHEFEKQFHIIDTGAEISAFNNLKAMNNFLDMEIRKISKVAAVKDLKAAKMRIEKFEKAVYKDKSEKTKKIIEKYHGISVKKAELQMEMAPLEADMAYLSSQHVQVEKKKADYEEKLVFWTERLMNTDEKYQQYRKEKKMDELYAEKEQLEKELHDIEDQYRDYEAGTARMENLKKLKKASEDAKKYKDAQAEKNDPKYNIFAEEAKAEYEKYRGQQINLCKITAAIRDQKRSQENLVNKLSENRNVIYQYTDASHTALADGKAIYDSRDDIVGTLSEMKEKMMLHDRNSVHNSKEFSELLQSIAAVSESCGKENNDDGVKDALENCERKAQKYLNAKSTQLFHTLKDLVSTEQRITRYHYAQEIRDYCRMQSRIREFGPNKEDAAEMIKTARENAALKMTKDVKKIAEAVINSIDSKDVEKTKETLALGGQKAKMRKAEAPVKAAVVA